MGEKREQKGKVVSKKADKVEKIEEESQNQSRQEK